MGAPKPAIGSVVAAAAFAFSCFILIVFVWRSFGGPVLLEPEPYGFHAQFGTEASQIAPGSDVRISGITVGDVRSTVLGPEGVEVEMELDSRFAPVPEDTTAIVRYKTLLGESFVELSQGDGPPLAEGGTLPNKQIQSAQQVDQVLSAFDEPTRDALTRLLRDLATAVNGRGADVNAALGNLAPATEQLTSLIQLLESQRSDVKGLISDSAVSFDAIGDQEAAVRNLITAGEEVLGVTAERNRELTATVEALPPFLDQLQGVLAEAEPTIEAASPALEALAPVAPRLEPALEATVELGPRLEELFGEAPPVMDAANEALPRATELIEASAPAVEALADAGPHTVPLVQYINAYRRELVAGFANTASVTQASTPRPDGTNYHYIRGVPPLWTEMIVGFRERLPSNRFNPYQRPQGMLDMLDGGTLHSFSCAHTSNPSIIPVLGGAPPCVEQEPWSWDGEARSYPHVEPFEP